MKRSGSFQYPFSARLEIEGYGMGYAQGVMKANATVILQLKEEGELTTDDCRKALDIVGFKGWSCEDVQDFITGKNEKELDKRIKEEKSDRWLGLCKEGVEYIEGKPVVYSLGDFWFNSETKYTTVLNLKVDMEGLKQMSLLPCRQENETTHMLYGDEAAQFYDYMRELSPNAEIDSAGVVSPAE